jgi:hypothetical protein
MNRSLAMQAVLVAASAMAITANAETESPHDFIDDIYERYRGKGSKGLALSNEAAIRRYFAPPLADAIANDFAAAQKAGEPPLLERDPFIDAQLREIENFDATVRMIGPGTAVATAAFVINEESRTVTLDLVTTPAGWRIADIRWSSGSLRTLYGQQ